MSSYSAELYTFAEEALAPLVWAEVWAYAGAVESGQMLMAANNICLAISYPDSLWITPKIREVKDTLVAEACERLPQTSPESTDYISDYVLRVIRYYCENPRFAYKKDKK